jgi:hypothetical protein
MIITGVGVFCLRGGGGGGMEKVREAARVRAVDDLSRRVTLGLARTEDVGEMSGYDFSAEKEMEIDFPSLPLTYLSLLYHWTSSEASLEEVQVM